MTHRLRTAALDRCVEMLFLEAILEVLKATRKIMDYGALNLKHDQEGPVALAVRPFCLRALILGFPSASPHCTAESLLRHLGCLLRRIHGLVALCLNLFGDELLG